MRIAVVMSGGLGRRFWPLSRARSPKQLLKMADGKTLLQMTIDRLSPIFDQDNIWVVTQSRQLEQTRQALKAYGDIKIFSEPVGKNTAPCVAYVASYARSTVGDAALVLLPADHFIEDEESFRKILSAGLGFVEKQKVLLTIGIKPERPATGFGYIRRGDLIDSVGGYDFYRVGEFTEKPSPEKARQYLDSGEYLWNAGIFLFKASDVIAEIEQYLPEMAAAFRRYERSVGTTDEATYLERCYSEVDPISVDYGVMEKTQIASVVPADIGWNDVGNWNSFAKYMAKDEMGNAVRGHHVGMGSTDCVIYSEKQVVATVGLRNLIVVATDDAILVMSEDRGEEVKQLVDLLEEQGLARLL